MPALAGHIGAYLRFISGIDYEKILAMPTLLSQVSIPARLARPPSARPRSSVVTWQPPEGMDQRTWIMAGRRLGALGRVSNWLIGDWVREGITRWGERYAEASRITGFDPHSLRNMAYVASRFDLSLRRDNLTWSHHALLAALERDEQVYWLDQATELKWSVADLRTMMRSARRGSAKTHKIEATAGASAITDDDVGVFAQSVAGARAKHDAAARSTVIKCPHCGKGVQLSPGY